MAAQRRSFPRHEPSDVALDSDDDVVVDNDAQARVELRLRHHRRRHRHVSVPVTVLGDDDHDDGDANDDDIEVYVSPTLIDLTGGSSPSHLNDTGNVALNLHHRHLQIDNIPLSGTCLKVGDQKHRSYPLRNGEVIRPGHVVELTRTISSFNVNHLVVHHIIRSPFGTVVLVGIPLGRNREMKCWLPPKANEACLILEACDHDRRPTEQQALVKVALRDVLRRRKIVYTNASYPTHRNAADFVCRWTCTLKYADPEKHRKGRPHEHVLRHIQQVQVPSEPYRVDEDQRRREWRGLDNVRGGTHQLPKTINGIEVATLDHDDSNDQQQRDTAGWIQGQPGQRYTFGDMFCGAGGTSCGARAAGFHVQLGCDADAAACQTYRLNYPEATLHEASVADIINSTAHIRVDVLHLSPPCQFFSPAHTRAGVNDEANTAALFACSCLVDKIRPRIFTLEQTFGLTLPNHVEYMNSLVRGFTEHGYSIRWSVVQLLTWGTAAQRKRLIIIGSCPGEPLPTLPRPTHASVESPRLGLRRFNTVARALRNSQPRRFDQHHQPQSMRRLNRTPWDPHQFLPRTITTSGVDPQFCHFSGTRAFTPREVAVLQGFPWSYRFSQTHVQKQAGNAFPPPAVKVLYDHIRKWLLNVDRVHPSSSSSSSASTTVAPTVALGRNIAATAQVLPGAVIVIPDDEELVGGQQNSRSSSSNNNNNIDILDRADDADEDDDDDDDVIMLDADHVFTRSPSRENFSRESTATLAEVAVETETCRCEEVVAVRLDDCDNMLDIHDDEEIDVVEISSRRVVREVRAQAPLVGTKTLV